jgi:hypothetical protein
MLRVSTLKTMARDRCFEDRRRRFLSTSRGVSMKFSARKKNARSLQKALFSQGERRSSVLSRGVEE